MRLYVTPSGHWAGTQSDAVKAAREEDAGRWKQFEVPTDKSGLLSFLNERRVRADPREAVPEAPPFVAPPPKPLFNRGDPAPGREGGPRLWSAGKDNDLICEAIDEAEGNALARFAEAVACRFQALAKEKIHG